MVIRSSKQGYNNTVVAMIEERWCLSSDAMLTRLPSCAVPMQASGVSARAPHVVRSQRTTQVRVKFIRSVMKMTELAYLVYCY